jgi:trimeric autotransporter adhesin
MPLATTPRSPEAIRGSPRVVLAQGAHNHSPTTMRREAPCVLSLLPCVAVPLLGLVVVAQTPSWSPDWAVAGIGGTVRAFADFGGELFAGGEWFAAKGGVIRGLARFDGADWRPVGTGIDLVNYTFPPLNTQVAAMAIFNGELVFAGTFDRVGGAPMNYIARWNGSSFAPLGQGLVLSFDEADVRGLAVFNNELYAAGQFDTAGGQPAAGIARWNGTSWSPVGTGLRLSPGGSVGEAKALHVHNGELVVAGEFGVAGGVAVNNIARWNGTTWSALGIGSLAPVYALESYGAQLIAAGQFQIGGNVFMPGAWNGTSWSGIGSNQPTIPSGALRTFGTDLYIDTNGALAKFDGTTWSQPGVVTGIFNGVEGTSIRALHVHGNELILGGQFTRAGSVPNVLTVASACAVAFDGGTGWRTLGTGNGFDRGPIRMLPWRGGKVAAGMFSEAGKAPATGLAFFDGDVWHMLGRLTGGGGPAVYDAAIWQDSVVVSGTFTSIDGQPFPGIARYDGTAWHMFGFFGPIGLYAHGNDLFAFGGTALQRWNGTSFATVATLAGGAIGELHTHSDGLLYATNNTAFNHRVLQWNGSQLQVIGTANSFVDGLGSYGTELVVGGQFTNINGTAATLIARWNGSAWSAMPAPVSGYTTYCFGELDGDLYAGVSGDPRGMMLRLHNGVWSGLGVGTNGVPIDLFVDRAIGSVLGSGDIITAGGMPTRGIAEWRTQPDWRNRLHGLAGAAGEPLLLGRGAVQGGSTLAWTIEGPATTIAILALGLSRIDQPLFGGTLVPSPDATLAFVTDAQGVAPFTLALPAATTAGLGLWSQAWLLDATGPQGFTATNALQCTTR